MLVCALITVNSFSNTDPYESLVLLILGQLLVDGPSSPFYHALLDAHIGCDYAPNTGYVSVETLESFRRNEL